MRVWLRRGFWALAAVGLLGLIGYGFMPQPIPVDFVPVTVGPLRVTIDEDGVTRVRQRYVVASPIGGQLKRITLKPGDPVHPKRAELVLQPAETHPPEYLDGPTVLATIEPKLTEFLDPSARLQADAKVKGAEAARDRAATMLRAAGVKLDHAQREAERVRRLDPRNVSDQEVQNVYQQERVAGEEVRAAQQASKMADHDLEHARAILQRVRVYQNGEAPEQLPIYSPITHKVHCVLKVEQESATVVTPGQKLLEVGDPTDLEVVIDVLSADAVKVREGARVLLEHWGGDKPLEARVRLVEPVGVMKLSALGVEEQRVNVIADPPKERADWARLGDGYRVEARIVVWEKEAVVKVPVGALFPHGGDRAVYVVADGRAQLRKVTAGKSNGLETEIVAGVEPGELVIVHAGDRVKDGTAVVARQ